MFEEITENMEKREKLLSSYATKSSAAIRCYEQKEDIRPAFFHDVDTIIYSNAYNRYMDKTQVYSFLENDHISKRMIHVQLVSKISRTIGRLLNLNEDLIEAIALGHDIGHTPLGHTGEKILDNISLRELNKPFMHNIQSIRTLLYLDKNGKGNNLTIQVLDGIMTHNGEMLNNIYEPVFKTKELFFKDFKEASISSDYAKKIRPMTLEGCVVRISDIIAYIGRDIEDAIKIGKFVREDIPEEIVKVLGNNNREIINNIILDIVKNSYQKNYIKMSDAVYKAINELKNFNYKNIYYKANSKEQIKQYEKIFNAIYKNYLTDLENKNLDSLIYSSYLSKMEYDYVNSTDKGIIVIDYIAGMTDDFFVREARKLGFLVN